MPITMQQILARLDTDEPEYAALAALGPEAIPHLKVLVRSDDPGIAAKAAYLATLINTDESADIMEAASASPHETVRVAAAAGMRNLTAAKAGPWVERLLDDSDPGVRKQALQTISALDLNLDPKVAKISTSDPEKELRLMAKDLQRASDTSSSVKTPKKAGKKTKPRKK
jgi:HEAT repeat protein